MKTLKITSLKLFVISFCLLTHCKTTSFILSDKIKSLEQNMSTDEAVNNLNSLLASSTPSVDFGFFSAGTEYSDMKAKATNQGILIQGTAKSSTTTFDVGSRTTTKRTENINETLKFAVVQSIILFVTKDRVLSFDKQNNKWNVDDKRPTLNISISDASTKINKTSVIISASKAESDLALASVLKLIPNAKFVTKGKFNW